MTKQITSLADLEQDDRNANTGTPRGRGMVETSLQKYGAGRSVLVDRNARLIAGNKTSEAAAAIGLDGVIVVQTDGTKLVVVQRTDLDLNEDTAARELAIADNRAGELGLEWSPDVLAELGQEIDLEPFFRRDEIARIMGELPDTDGLWQGMPEFEQNAQQDKYKSITVHFESAEHYREFAGLISQRLTEQTNFIWYPYKPTHGVSGSMQVYQASDES